MVKEQAEQDTSMEVGSKQKKPEDAGDMFLEMD
jgi:hypothetical protein